MVGAPTNLIQTLCSSEMQVKIQQQKDSIMDLTDRIALITTEMFKVNFKKSSDSVAVVNANTNSLTQYWVQTRLVFPWALLGNIIGNTISTWR